MAEAERFKEWGFESEPGSAEIVDELFKDKIIEWNRLGPMQDVTLRLIAERAAGLTEGTTYVRGELLTRPSILAAPSRQHKYHLYCSLNNAGAMALATEVKEARRLSGLECSMSRHELPSCEAMLIYLTGRTWTSEDGASGTLAEEVEQAMQAGIRLVLAHEMPGLGQQEDHCACEFDLQKNQTPPKLLAAGIYSWTAVPLKGGAWREASMALLAEAIAGKAAGESSKLAMIRSSPQPGLLPRPSSWQAVQGLSLSSIKRISHPEESDSSPGAPSAEAASLSTPAVRLQARFRLSLLLQRWRPLRARRPTQLLEMGSLASTYQQHIGLDDAASIPALAGAPQGQELKRFTP